MRNPIPLFGIVVLLTGSVAPALAQHPSVYTLVAELRKQSHSDALTIKEEYRPLMDEATFDDTDDLLRALQQGELVPLSSVELPHLRPRLGGQSYIGQKDPDNQHLYATLRPATMGMLIDLTRRMDYGALEITSASRTAEYQRLLMRGNSNANTDVPTHAMGYAVDIGLKYATEEGAKTLRRALDEMRDEGRVYFIAERNQLTFHVVPVPERFEHFEALYHETVAAALTPEPAAAPAPEPAETVEADSPSRWAEIWSWITGLFS